MVTRPVEHTRHGLDVDRLAEDPVEECARRRGRVSGRLLMPHQTGQRWVRFEAGTNCREKLVTVY